MNLSENFLQITSKYKEIYSKYKEVVDFIFKNEKNELNLIGKITKITFIYLTVIIINKLLKNLINKALEKRKKSQLILDKKRAETLLNISYKIINVLVIFIGVMTALEVFNIDTKPILATAGVGGLAIGFGAQSLVKDLITGFFILLEDQYSVGDHVEIEGKEGIVEDLGLRVTKIRDFTGELYIIPNSNISIVTNKTRGLMRATVILSISYEEDIDKVLKIIRNNINAIWKENDDIVEKPELLGVSDLKKESIEISIIAMCKPTTQWSVERYLRKELIEALYEEGIKIPYTSKITLRGDSDL